MDDVERLAQVVAVHHKGDVGGGGSLGAGYNTDAVASERAEEFAGYSYAVLQVLSDHSHGGEAVLYLDRLDGPARYLRAEFSVEGIACRLRVIFADAY